MPDLLFPTGPISKPRDTPATNRYRLSRPSSISSQFLPDSCCIVIPPREFSAIVYPICIISKYINIYVIHARYNVSNIFDVSLLSYTIFILFLFLFFFSFFFFLLQSSELLRTGVGYICITEIRSFLFYFLRTFYLNIINLLHYYIKHNNIIN